jgi:lipid-A-disaccharide synthase
MKYYLIAGETSGDLHGKNLIRKIKEEDPEAEFRFVGGDGMREQAGSEPLLHTSQLAFMGFVEVLANLRTIRRNMRLVKKDLEQVLPDALILIDFPGFNLAIATHAKKLGIPVYYYISPKIWAWNQKRVHKIKRLVHQMYCILPFEVDFYQRFGMEVKYVGNPLMDALSQHQLDKDFRQKHALDERPIIALLPGSRKMELEKLLPVMGSLRAQFPSYQLVIAGAPNFTKADYERYIPNLLDFTLVFGATYDLVRHAAVAAVASGTATLETALLNTPQVVVYRANALTVMIARQLIKVNYISLVNLINDAPTVKELIQQDCTLDTIADELNRLLTDATYRQKQLDGYAELQKRVGGPGASERTAVAIVRDMKLQPNR